MGLNLLSLNVSEHFYLLENLLVFFTEAYFVREVKNKSKVSSNNNAQRQLINLPSGKFVVTMPHLRAYFRRPEILFVQYHEVHH